MRGQVVINHEMTSSVIGPASRAMAA